MRNLRRQCVSCERYPAAATLASAALLVTLGWMAGLPALGGALLASGAALIPLAGWLRERRTRGALDHSLRELVDNAPSPALLLSASGHILRANRACEALFAQDAPLAADTPPDRLPAPWAQWLAAQGNGASRPGLVSIAVDVAGEACRLMLIDGATELGSPQADTPPLSPRTQRILQQIVDVIPHPVYVKDRRGRYVLVNEAFARERDLTVAQMIGKDALALAFPDPPMIAKEDESILAGGVVLKEESVLQPLDGGEVSHIVSKRRSLGEHGQPIIVGAHFDVTPWRRAEHELRVQHDRQKALRERTQLFIQRLIDVIPDPVYVKDHNSRFLLVNKAFAKERGRPPESIVGLTSFDIAPNPATARMVRDEDDRVLNGGEINKEQHTTHPVTGEEVFRVVTKRLSYDADNAPVIVGAHFDLTRWKIAERELTEAMAREREQRLRVQAFMQRMIDVIPQPVYLKDTDSRYVMINDAFARERQLPREKIVGHSAEDLTDPQSARLSREEDIEILAGRSVHKEETAPHPATGAERFRIISKRACLDADGKPVIVGANFDVTEWRLAERELTHTAERERGLRERVQAFTQRLIDVIPQPVYVKSADSRYLMVNKALAEEIGRPPAELVGKNPLDLGATPDYANIVTTEDARVIAGVSIYKEEHILHPYRGQEAFRVISKGCCLDATGNPVVVGANFDITSQRQAERQAREALVAQSHVRDFLQSLIGALPSPLYVEDDQGKLLIVNRAFRQLIGEPHRDLIGTGTIEYGPDGLRRALAYCHTQATGLDEGHVFETELQFNVEQGARHYMLRAVRGLGVEGRAVIVGILSDVSIQREAEARGAQAKDQAERASRAKSLFLASMSHEIRTPLAAVIGTLELTLRRDALPTSARDLIGNSLSNAESLLGIINDILDFSKIEAGQLELEHIDFDLRAIAVECLRILQNNARARSLRLVIDIDPQLPTWFKGDPTRVRQILINLVGNALKFTERGSVALRVATLDPAGAQRRIRFRVEDTGIGIPTEALPRLFGKFQQADTSTTRKYGGTGLGLAICRELVEAMGGEISVTSKPGVGSTFEFILPLEPGEAPPVEEAAPLPAHEQRLKVLCAEDYPTNQIIIRALLEDMGHQVSMVETGLQALRALAADDYDLVLMDGRMPEMDGQEAVKCIRRGSHDGIMVRDPRIPVIALTANASTEDRREYLAAGMDDFLTKPVELRHLHETLARVIRGEFRDNRTPLPELLPPPAPLAAPLPSIFPPLALAAGWEVLDIKSPEGISASLHGKLLQMFAGQIPHRLEELMASVAASDLPALATLAHGIRGSASMLGAQRLANVAGTVEDAARHGDRDSTLGAYASLQAELLHTHEALTGHVTKPG